MMQKVNAIVTQFVLFHLLIQSRLRHLLLFRGHFKCIKLLIQNTQNICDADGLLDLFKKFPKVTKVVAVACSGYGICKCICGYIMIVRVRFAI